MNLPKELPIWEAERAILEALREKQVVIVSAETGSGKTTQLPQMFFGAGYWCDEPYPLMIGVTQPRVMAAISVARRVADEMGKDDWRVGYQTRFVSDLCRGARIKYATDGIFLQEARTDPLFGRYLVLMLDEVHERSISIDTLLGLVKRAIRERPEFRVIVSSATVNIPELAKFFGDDAVVVEANGRLFPIEQIFEETDPKHRFINIRNQRYELPEFAANKTAQIIRAGETGDMLVFLTGLDDLERAQAHLEQARLPIEILLAYGEMELRQMEMLFESHARQRVILATNVAETSVTIPGIRVVIDSTRVKKDVFDPETGIVGLQVFKTSKASSCQRAGRAGRTSPGKCYFLCTREDFESRPEYDEPAIQRSNLANVILTLAAVGIKDLVSFPFLDQPKPELIKKAVADLQKIGALSEDSSLAEYGRVIARFPLEPAIVHLLVQSAEHGAVAEMATLWAMMEARPFPRRSGYEPRRWEREFAFNARSDPELMLRVWQAYYQSGFDWQWAKDMGLNPRRMEQARNIRGQLLKIASDQGFAVDAASSDLGKLKLALIAAMPDNVARVSGFRAFAYQSAGGLSGLFIHPSSVTMEYTPPILWFFSVQVTSKPFMHCVMAVTAEELKTARPDYFRVTVRESGGEWSWSEHVYIYRDTYWGTLTVGTELIEKRPIVREPGLISRFTAFWDRVVPSQPRELTADELAAIQARLAAQREEQRQQEREEAERWQEAQALVAELPAVPAETPAEVRQLADRIRWGLTPPSHQISDGQLDSCRREIAKLEQMLDAHHRTTVEYQQKLAECQQELADILDLLDRCPKCGSVLGDEGRCHCVGHLTASQVKTNGQVETDLVTISTQAGLVLARIVLICNPGAQSIVQREARPVTEPFEGELRLEIFES